jgi:hypothetical protein
MAHSRCHARSRHHGSYRRCCGPNLVLDGGSPPRRSRRGQADGERVAGENHEGNQPSDGAFTVGIGADQLGHVADNLPHRTPWFGTAEINLRLPVCDVGFHGEFQG